MDPRFERSVRRWLVGYPRRWRLARADEVTGVLADLAGPGATRLDLRSGLGLLVNGVATRRRMLPPLAVRMRYRLGLERVPRQYRGWLADDIASPVFQWRLMALAVTPQLVLVGVRISAGGARLGEIAWWLAWLVLMFVMPRTRAQRDAAARHLAPYPGEPPTPWDVRSTWVLHDRLPARWLVAVAGAAAAVAAVAGTSSALAGARWNAALTVCLGVGALAALRIGVRARARLSRRPPQPARRVVAASRRMVASLCCWFLLVASAATALFPNGAVTVSAPVVLGLALVVLPPLTMGALLAVHGPADLAAVDVRRLLFGWGPLPVDTPTRGVVPAWSAPDPSLATAPAPPAPADPATA